ncbi:MAG: DEAD/DEAH box helicase family protein [Brevinematia bacterium]
MKLEKYLVLNKYFLSLFGVDEFKDLKKELENTNPGYDSDGRSYFVNKLRSMNNLKISEDNLLRYDKNITNYVRKINEKRQPKITLKYFQYLAILFTEIFLDNLKNKKREFLYDLNKFMNEYKKKEKINIVDNFSEDDLKKLAFWMATGSGKTLIAHINYYQFFHYQLFTPDNILFITPNEGLSKQHFEELQKSGIPCKLYEGNLNYELKSEKEVLILEITKLVEEKRSSGVTLPVDAFEGRNLLFVDEGHKGKRSEEQKWARLRNKLAKEGFAFEYSATFGQILNEKDLNTLKEYARSIIFDYSYKYFYLDGYGKDFSVLNVKPGKISDSVFQETIFSANLLSFYQQIITFEENKHLAKEHNIEKPLWIFVGTTVTGKQEQSDVIQIVKFIKRAIEEENWLQEQVDKILNGETGLKDEKNEDIFSQKFEILRAKGIDFNDLKRKVFGGKGALGIYELKSAEGELGLKVGENDYFGVINIGDVREFKKHLEKEGIIVNQDAISSSLFENIKKEDSKINILIGSKKFIEGWDTWRVSSMGLLNIGTGQGPQIIQLFGRGVRLKGKGMSLTRSGNEKIKLLETLNIFSIKADYLSKFLEAINKEEVEFETIEIPVKPQHEDKWESLKIPWKDESKKFEELKVLLLNINDRININLDFLPRISQYLAEERKEIKTKELKPNLKEEKIPQNILNVLNWEKIYQEICDFKLERGYWNLIFDRKDLENLLLSNSYSIIAPFEISNPKNQKDIESIEDIAVLVIKKYIDSFYKEHAKRFETENLHYSNVKEQLSLFNFEKSSGKYVYKIQVNKKEKDLIEKVRKLVKNLDELLKAEDRILPQVYFDRHLYLPILLQDEKFEKMTPSGLVESEEKFIKGLREYLKSNQEKFKHCEVYLLRNFPKTGVGFQLHWHGFYPDFIMWLKDGDKQTIVFIDPKGLEHTRGLDDEKIQFSKEIKELERELNENNITLKSFILSNTVYQTLIDGMINPPKKDEYIQNNVLFLDDEDWPKLLFEKSIYMQC